MALDIFQTHYLLMAIEGMDRANAFLRDRYFPCNTSTDVFTTDDVITEYMDGTKRLAPFVAPRAEGVTILRNGYSLHRYTPPYIAPRRILTIDDLSRKGFGEALFSTLTPAQRQVTMIMRDIDQLDRMITRREEAMAAEVMLTNGCVMQAMADKEDVTEEMEVRYYEGETNPAVYTPAKLWSDPTAPIMDDLAVMVGMLASHGLPASELICAPDVANAIINNDAVYKFLDNRRFELGSIVPAELGTPGAAIIARLNIMGRMIDIISYAETYTADDGTDTAYIPSGMCVMTAPAAGRTLYGAVTQIEESDRLFHTYAGRRIPKYISSVDGNTRTVTLKARPLMMPNNKNPFISAKVLGE